MSLCSSQAKSMKLINIYGRVVRLGSVVAVETGRRWAEVHMDNGEVFQVTPGMAHKIAALKAS